MDLKRLKADLQSSRCTEQELRSQINSLSVSERTAKMELVQLRQENDNFQAKLVSSLSCIFHQIHCHYFIVHDKVYVTMDYQVCICAFFSKYDIK